MQELSYRTVEDCRICDTRCEELFDFGAHYISDFLEMPCSAEQPVPLVLMRCRDCGLVQLRDEVPRDRLYRTYWYKSGLQPAMVQALREVKQFAGRYAEVERGDWVIDIGANDGTLLSMYAEQGVNRVAFDPAVNLHSELREKCDILVPTYFPAEQYSAPAAKVITSIAMFYDLPDPRAFVREIRRLLHKDGVWVLQLGDLRAVMVDMAFDAVCHEHLEYYSMITLRKLIEGEGLQVVAAERNFVNGGSLRLAVRHPKPGPVDSSVERLTRLDEELEQGMMWDYWRQQLLGLKLQVRNMVANELAAGRVVDVLGASTKGNTLLQYFKLGNGRGGNWLPIRRAIERAPAKVGRYTAGSWIQVVGEEAGLVDPAEKLLVLPWHFKQALLERERAKAWPSGTKLVFPLPLYQEVPL